MRCFWNSDIYSEECWRSSVELIFRISCFQRVQIVYYAYINCCLRQVPYTHNVINCTWRYHLWRRRHVWHHHTDKNADSGPDMALHMCYACSLMPYWYQISSHLSFYWPFILAFYRYLVTLCFVVLLRVLYRHRCGTSMRHNKSYYFKLGLQYCCNL